MQLKHRSHFTSKQEDISSNTKTHIDTCEHMYISLHTIHPMLLRPWSQIQKDWQTDIFDIEKK